MPVASVAFPHLASVCVETGSLQKCGKHLSEHLQFWVDTDDLNDGKNRRGKDIKNDLHYSAEGYKTLGKRFAESCLKPLGK